MEEGGVMMHEPLFNGKDKISNEDMINRVEWYIEQAEEIWKISQEFDKRVAIELARDLRNELREEYRNNDLIKTRDFYRDNDLFRKYSKAIAQSAHKPSGRLTYNNLNDFLGNVKSYLGELTIR